MEFITIDPNEPLNPGLDYAYLKAEGTTLVQQLSGDIWTDYNEHDPGVTTLEQLCYALTELSYRAEIPLEDLLIDPCTGKIDPDRQALFIPRQIFPCNPVTENDYRKLVVDRVAGVNNAWFVPYCARVPQKRINGLYDIWLYAPGIRDPVCHPKEKNEILQQTWQVYNQHRGLCEDAHTIRVLQPVRTRVFGNVLLEDFENSGKASANTPDSILAELLFQLGLFLAPELKRGSLKSRVDAGVPSGEIFNGPLLLHGFIDDDQLQPKAAEIPVRDLASVMAAVPGVASVARVRARVGRETYRGTSSIPVGEEEVLELETGPQAWRGGFTLRLYQHGVEIQPDAARVERELARRWRDYRRTYPLEAQYPEYFAFPEGRPRDVRQYYSIQNQYPGVYGIGTLGLPEDCSIPRQAQAKQLKGYLLAYDQLLADFFAQLARVRDLYSTEIELHHTYFYQYLYRSVPDVGPLLKVGDDGYRQGLPELVDSQDPAIERRNRFLDLLLALYAESLDSSSIWPSSCLRRPCDGEDTGDSGRRLIRAKLALLHQLVESTADRGRGFDIMASLSRRNVAGMEIKCRIQLGMGRWPLTTALEALSIELVESESEASIGRPLRRDPDAIDERFQPVASLAGPSDAAEGSTPPSPSSPPPLAAMPRSESITEEGIWAAAQVENFRIGSIRTPGRRRDSGVTDSQMRVVCRASRESEWRLIGRFADSAAATACVQDTVDRLGTLAASFEQLYLVEHNLLRFGRAYGKGSHPFSYSFTLTAVISTCTEQLENPNYQGFAREVLRQNAPAHVVVETCFLRPWQMCWFEDRYWAWRRALRRWSQHYPPRACDWRRLVQTSAQLRQFLERCQRQDAGSPP